MARRTKTLHAAKVHGADVAAAIADLVSSGAAPRIVADVGCGRGTTTLQLAQRFPAARLVAADLSPPLLRTARQRLPLGVTAVCADFHHLPFADGCLDVAVAAFCLYHSPRPSLVLAELARCLVPGGRAVLVTKSADSYHELDMLVAASGLDPAARRRRSLYASFHSGNATRIVGRHLSVRRVVHQRYIFRFTDPAHLAAYLATTPKYELPAEIATDPHEGPRIFRTRNPLRFSSGREVRHAEQAPVIHS